MSGAHDMAATAVIAGAMHMALAEDGDRNMAATVAHLRLALAKLDRAAVRVPLTPVVAALEAVLRTDPTTTPATPEDMQALRRAVSEYAQIALESRMSRLGEGRR